LREDEMKLRASDVIETIPRTLHWPELAGQHVTYEYDVEDAGTWRLRFNDGRLDILDGPGDADTVFSCAEQDFVDILGGSRNLFTAVLQGRVRVHGNLTTAIKFPGLIAAAHHAHARGAGSKR
jgi:putative sterol carrier protein